MKLTKKILKKILENCVVHPSEMKDIIAYCENEKPLNRNLDFKGELYFQTLGETYFYICFGINAAKDSLHFFEQTVFYNAVNIWAEKVMPSRHSDNHEWYHGFNYINSLFREAITASPQSTCSSESEGIFPFEESENENNDIQTSVYLRRNTI